MAGAVVAGKENGGYDNFADAADAMTGMLDEKFLPDAESQKVYDRLYVQYKRLHDSFGTREYGENLFDVMKELLAIRDEVRG